MEHGIQGGQAGGTPGAANMNQPADAGGAANPTKDVSNNPPAIDYKSFFESHVQAQQSRRDELASKLATATDEREKFNVEKEIFEIEKQLHQFGIGQQSQTVSVPDNIPAEAKSFIQDITKGLSPQEAKNVIDFASGLISKVTGEAKPNVANLNDRPGDNASNPAGGNNTGWSSRDMVGEKGNEAKLNFLQLMTEVIAKEQQRR